MTANSIVGRREELGQISTLADEARKKGGRTLVVSGEGGVGKTHLLTAAANGAERDGWKVALGRAYSVETGIPYALFADALLPLITSLEPGTLSVLTRGGMSELAYLFPVLAGPGDRERVRAGVDPAELKARLLWNFTQFLGRLSARQPLCIVLENLQWADASSLELLHFVARNISGHPILILASYNETERDNNPTLKSTEQSLVGLGVATHMHLAPLSDIAVEQMVTRRFDSDTTPVRDFAKRLYDWTLGNPFFVEETLKWLIQAGSLKRHGGQWTGWDLESLELPPTVRDAVVSRIERLKPGAREAAVVAAVVGTRLTFDKLLSISGLNESDLANSLDDLVAAKVFDEVRATQETSYDFAHPILQQVLYDSLGAGEAALLHSRIAEALESHYGKAASSHSGELAFHFSRSGALKTKAVKYLSQAGKTALDTYANREAAGFLAAALEQMDRQDTSAADRDEVVRNLARARQRLGEYDEALSLWATALSAARRANDHESVATIEYRMGLACFWSGRFEDALDHYGSGLHSAAQGSNSAALVRVYLAKAICLQEMGRIELAKADAESALRAAEDSGSASLLARAHRALLLLYAWTGPADVALAHGKKAIAFSESAGEGMLEWTAHWGLALLSGLTGSGTDMAAHLAQCGRLEDQLRSPLLPLWTAELALQHASWTGEWDDGIATGERTIALARSLRQRTLLPRLLVWTGLLYLWRHDLARARKYFDEGWQLSDAGGATEQRVDVQTVVPAHMGLAAYHLETGNFAEAIRIGEAGIELADRIGYIAWSVQWLLPVVGEAALWNHDFERAEKHCARMRRDGQRLSNPVALAMADACDGMLLLQRDRNPLAAIPVLRSAITMLDQIPLPDVASRIRRVLAHSLKDSGDREGAMRELKLAHDAFARLGAEGQLDNIRKEMRELGTRPPSRTFIEGMGGLTGRELEIARMVAQRKTNREIGAALDISSRTVSTHLSNIFAKVKVGSRGELTDFVRESSLLDD